MIAHINSILILPILIIQVHGIDDQGETNTQVIRCGSGLDENRAVAHCSNCCYYLCETCLNNHKVFTRGHNTVLLEEVKQSDKPTAAKSLQKVQYCKDHEDEVLKLFCKTCKKVICRDCALVKHRDHDYTFIREIRPEIQRQLEALIKGVQAKEVEYKSHIDYLENVRGIGTNTLGACEREVNETFNRLQEAIESRRAALIAQLHDIHDSEKKQVDLEAERLQSTLSKLSNSIGFTQQLLANGSDVEVVSMSVQAVQTLENLKTVNWNKNSIKPTLMRVKFDPEFEKHVNEFGTTSHEIQPEDLLVKLPKKTADVGQEIKFEVHLSKEISERGYDATSELAVQLIHTTDNARIVCDLRKTKLNTWEASCIPKAAGKYKVSAVLGKAQSATFNLLVKQPASVSLNTNTIPILNSATTMPLCSTTTTSIPLTTVAQTSVYHSATPQPSSVYHSGTTTAAQPSSVYRSGTTTAAQPSVYRSGTTTAAQPSVYHSGTTTAAQPSVYHSGTTTAAQPSVYHSATPPLVGYYASPLVLGLEQSTQSQPTHTHHEKSKKKLKPKPKPKIVDNVDI